MTSSGPKATKVAWQLALWAVVLFVAMIAIGYVPTQRIAGQDAVMSMIAGCAISLVASIVGIVPVVLASRGPVDRIPVAALTATAIRFLVVLALALAAALSGWFDRPALLVWVAISYLVLLVADTIVALRLNSAARAREE